MQRRDEIVQVAAAARLAHCILVASGSHLGRILVATCLFKPPVQTYSVQLAASALSAQSHMTG